MQPYEQPTFTGFDDEYLLPPPAELGGAEFDAYERRKRFLTTCYMTSRAFVTALPIFFFFTIFLNVGDFFDVFSERLEYILGAIFRASLVVSFLASLGVLWTFRRSLPASVATRSPALSVLGFFVPVLNLYWYYLEFSRGFKDADRALEELDGNRLATRTGASWGAAALACFSLACLFFIWTFFTTYAASEFWRFASGRMNFFGEDELGALGCIATYGFLYASCAFHLGATRRMADAARRILEVRQSVEPLATEAERASERARLESALRAPPTR